MLVLALSAPLAFGQAECDRHCAQVETSAKFKEADAELNRVYKRLLSSLPQAQRSRLRVEQRRWVHDVRDASCTKRIETEWGRSCPTTWCLVAEEQCRASETVERTKQLEEIMVRGPR
ncbi:lysozyme inhibitor LprI family protein [Polaromonas sp. A23]|uniref:lysozyme inhibitor LprI family protein n=1 Tax=Polaromonas sp. A23 TaxID=1944133 RepID=UPI00352A3A46